MKTAVKSMFVFFTMFPLLLVFFSPALAQDKTEEAKRESISVYQKTSGIIESTKMVAVTTNLEAWKDLRIDFILPQGATVKKGDRLVSFEKDDFENAIADAELALRSAKFDLQDAEMALKQTEKTHDLETEQAKREIKQAREDYQHYVDVEVPRRDRMAEYSLESSKWRLENAEEEYNQLKKMYEEDELTEESELIVLKRAKRSVESAQMFLKNAKEEYQHNKEVVFPREDLKKKKELERKEIEHQKVMADLNTKRDRAAVAVEKAKHELEKQKTKLADLNRDGDHLTLTAPTDGLVYYGAYTHGNWVGATGSPDRQIEVGDKIPVNKTLLTIVDPESLRVRVDVDQALLGKIEKGATGQLMVKSVPHKQFAVTVEKLGRIPLGNGKYECVASLDVDNSGMMLMPGMKCEVVFSTYTNPDATTVSKDSVFTDDEGLSHYVYKKTDAGPQKVEVSVGETSGGRIEVTSGLEPGAEIFKSKPNG